MSNKNLKVYRILFMNEIHDMQFKVKFPCQVKMIWKRSNQTAETTPVPVTQGVVCFNQTIKLYVNMYFDTTTNKFVEKKCIFNFLILTDKGQKSAGSVTYDLAQLFNKRAYQVNQQFVLQKCPLPDTKVRMRIYYEQSTQTGYDSMSKISTSSQLDISTASMDMHEEDSQNNKNQIPASIQENKSKQSLSDTASKQISSQKDKQQTQSNYDLLNQSDLGMNINVTNLDANNKNQKITENIQALNKITGKINDFVSRCSGNIKNQIQNLKHQNKTLKQAHQSSKSQIIRLTKQKQQDKQAINNLKKNISQLNITHQAQVKKGAQKIQQITHKLLQLEKINSQMQKNLEKQGQSQSSYIAQLKSGFEQRQNKLKEKLQISNDQLQKNKRQKNNLQNQLNKSQQNFHEIKSKFLQTQQKIKSNQIRQAQRQKQLSDLRYKLQNVYEEIVKSLGSLSIISK